ncbi:hypothetical protein [Aliikangiella sp. IMCC44359]|uniref:hypothetical protein n=1 Tax=Aliikangiella sp. IMCC44359 TaxID=3459125 RepID=UPI00403B36AA
MQEQSLLEKYLPSYTFSEYHDIIVDNPSIEAVYDIGRNVDMSKSMFIPRLLKLRGLPTENLNAPEFIKAMNFTDIEQDPPREQLYGFLKADKILPVTSYQQFVDNPSGASLKVVFSFQYYQLNDCQVKVSTETRVQCIGLKRTFQYTFYWIVIRFFSGLIRKEILKLIKQKAQQ